MLLYEVWESEEDAHIMKCSYTRSELALCFVIQKTEPQASPGVSSLDLCLLPIWKYELYFDLILHIFHKAWFTGGVLLDMEKNPEMEDESFPVKNAAVLLKQYRFYFLFIMLHV